MNQTGGSFIFKWEMISRVYEIKSFTLCMFYLLNALDHQLPIYKSSMMLGKRKSMHSEDITILK